MKPPYGIGSMSSTRGMYLLIDHMGINSAIKSLEPGDGECQRDRNPSASCIPGRPGLPPGEFLGWTGRTVSTSCPGRTNPDLPFLDKPYNAAVGPND